MLKNARLYKDGKGYIWHVMEDGTAMQYPTFTHHDKPATGTYKEVSQLNTFSTPVTDCLYLAVLGNGKTTLVVAENIYKASCFDIFTGDWVAGDFELFPVANLICGHEYIVDGKEMTLDYYDDESETFVFLPNGTELGACVKLAQICGVKEVPKMPKMYEIWKDKNGQACGRDCKTGRVFEIGAYTFDNVDRCAHDVQAGDTVYIKNESNICPYSITTISKAAKELNDDTVLLRYAYGYMPSMTEPQEGWTVLWTDIAYAVIERKTRNVCYSILLCVPKSNLGIKGSESDSKRD